MDRFGAKRTFGIFLLASACAVFLYSFATGAVAILVGGAVVGFFSNGMFAGYGALISSFYQYKFAVQQQTPFLTLVEL